MGCSCTSNTPVVSSFKAYSIVNQSSETDCGYNADELLNWKRILECVKGSSQAQQLGLKNSDINIFLGNIISALNNQICSFKTKLDQIQPYILTTINLNICQA